MAQFDVYRNANPASVGRAPFLLDVQSDLLEPLATRVVVPLVRVDMATPPMTRLNPAWEVEGVAVLMSTSELAGISRSALGARFLSLRERRQEIVAALDLLFTGL